MPTFPHHRNLKNQKESSGTSGAAKPIISDSSNLPAISDLLGSLVKKRRFD